MATSITSVCNSALIKVGADRISDITEDTHRAQLLNAIFDSARDDVMRAHPWKFAVKRMTLAPNASTPAFEFDFSYDLPADCIRPLGLWPDWNDYAVEADPLTGNKVLLTDLSTINFLYIWRQIDPTQWDSNFAEAFAWRLARDIAYALTQSAALVDQCDKKSAQVIAEARSMSAVEAPIMGLEADTWTLARKTYGIRSRWGTSGQVP